MAVLETKHRSCVKNDGLPDVMNSAGQGLSLCVSICGKKKYQATKMSIFYGFFFFFFFFFTISREQGGNKRFAA